MSFRPNPNDELTIESITYRIAEHPAAPGMPHGQEGRAGIVYHLVSDKGDAALKVFKPRFRLPFLVSQSRKLIAFADLPGLQAARRTVLAPARQPDLLRQYPELAYAVLMPWIEGPTWLEVMLGKQTFSPGISLALAQDLTKTLVKMEEHGVAHCDLSGPNVMLTALAEGHGDIGGSIALVDLEGMYAPGMIQPQALSSGSAGYAHRSARGGLWEPEADRFSGAVLLAEMLGWCDASVVDAAWGESYFDPDEVQQNSERYSVLINALRRNWGNGVADLFERAWHTDALIDCPTFGEWLITLPAASPSRLPESGKGFTEKATGEKRVADRVRATMQAANQQEERGDLDEALKLYRRAYELASKDRAMASVAREIELILRDLEAQSQGMVGEGTSWRKVGDTLHEHRPQTPQEGRSPMREVLEEDEGPSAHSRRQKSFWKSALKGLLVVLLIGLISVGGWYAYSNWQANARNSQIAAATAQAAPWFTVTAQAQATAVALSTQEAEVTEQAGATATAIVSEHVTMTAQASSTRQAQERAATATARALIQAATGTSLARAKATAQAMVAEAQKEATSQAATAVAQAQSTSRAATAAAQARATSRAATVAARSRATSQAATAIARSMQRPGLLMDFEQAQTWRRGDEPYGRFERSTERARSGDYSARLSYDFPAVNNNYVVFLARPPLPISDHPTGLTAWVYGNNSGHFLNVWIRDSAGEVRQYTFGRIRHNGWQRMTAWFDDNRGWPNGHISGPDNGVLDFPVRFYAFVLDGVPDGQASSGTIYIDEVFVTTQPLPTPTQPPPAPPPRSATTRSALLPGAPTLSQVLRTVGMLGFGLLAGLLLIVEEPQRSFRRRKKSRKS